MIKSLRAAFSFLTILPLTHSETEGDELAGSSAWFPLAGFALGAIYWGTAFLLSGRVNRQLLCFLILALMALITGAIHIDGLADFADSLGGRDREERLRIMQDPHQGSFGVIAVVLLLLGKFLALDSLVSGRHLVALLAAPGMARLSLTLLLATTPYARASGLATEFSRRGKSRQAGLALAITLAVIIALNQWVLWAGLAAVLVITFLFRLLAQRLLGGFTGDVLGACAECCELGALLVIGLFAD